MAKLIRRHDNQYVLLTHEGEQLGSLDRRTQPWRLYLAGRTDWKEFNSPADCCEWLETEQGLNVELVDQI